MKAIELFAGAGGLAMGTALAGFEHEAVVEWDRWACDTLRENKDRGFPLVKNWPLFEDDVREFDLSIVPEGIDLLAGGPPCQAFSLGGKHRAHEDHRDMFPATAEIISKVKPRAFIIENVKGLTRSAFANYLSYIHLQFEFPEIKRKDEEKWEDHLVRLEKEKTSGVHVGLTYEVVRQLLDTANYGIPQRRWRLFLVGFRNDLGVRWNFPPETHSADALLIDQWVTGDYWDRHAIARSRRPEPPRGLADRISRLRQANLWPSALPWKTVRDAFAGLPNPERTGGVFRDHKFQPGARSYVGHTGSPLDLPAKTLKAGVHGVPGGENMMVKDGGGVRYFTVRESARLQTFPDGYVFHGAWGETMRQLGNAVPVALAHLVAATVATQLIGGETRRLVAGLEKVVSKPGAG